MMTVISNKDDDLLSQFDNINKNDIPVLERLVDLAPQILSNPQEKMLRNNHTDANKRILASRRYFWILQNFQKGN